MSRPSFNAKLKRDTWTVEELRAMACAIGCSFKAYFEFPDGKQV
jgi:hypothetical protein